MQTLSANLSKIKLLYLPICVDHAVHYSTLKILGQLK